jgi:predicted phosphodiesterase
MRIIALGDTHGRVLWKEIVAKEKDADKIVFIGDYFDTHYDITVDQQIENFKEILEFKKNNMDQVVLLLGNHDYHYLKGVYESYSGYKAFRALDINEVLQPAVDSGLVQMCFTHDKYVFTHAGVTKTWSSTYNVNLDNLQESINQLFLENISAFRFEMGNNYDQTGDDVTQPPIWVRIPSLFKDIVDGITCVIGHTTLKELTITDKLIGIDTLGTTGEYLEINDLVPTAKKL